MVETKLHSLRPADDKRPYKLSLAALIIGVVAIGLACIPALAFDRPLLNPFAAAPKTPEAEKRAEAAEVSESAEPSGGVVFKYKSFSIRLGGKPPRAKEEPPATDAKVEDTEQPATPAVETLHITTDPTRWFTIFAIGTALIGLVVASVGQLREKHNTLTAISVGCCTAAMTWQYFAIGIAFGAAIAAFLIILCLLGSLLGGGG